MKQYPIILAALALTLALGACTASLGGPDPRAAFDPSVEVTRFHNAESLTQAGKGSIAIIPVNDDQLGSAAYRAFEQALERELVMLGYDIVRDKAAADQTARIAYEIIDPDSDREPYVSPGGPPGAFGQSVGLGVNIPFGGLPKDVLIYRLDVRLSDQDADRAIWEGRAIQQAQIGTRATDPEFFAPILARALFSDFPGPSGKTIIAP